MVTRVDLGWLLVWSLSRPRGVYARQMFQLIDESQHSPEYMTTDAAQWPDPLPCHDLEY